MSDHTERIIRFDRARQEGVRESLSAARRFLYDTPRALAATHLAWALPGAVVHFWDDKGHQHFVAHDDGDDSDLVDAPLDHFESRSLPISRHLGREALVGDGEPAAEGEGEPTEWRVRFSAYMPMDGYVVVTAFSEEEAIAKVKASIDEYAPEANDEAMERLDHYINRWEGFSSCDVEEAEPLD